ncbi:nucleoside phosphorylase [Yinghuangia seranimata]|uniref:nucleoside phosphorylase n=1 Tax=Yinghuangia seranimata TaxID=408067 RepID=UPI00248B21EC|nr:nucleoside phosphorylase [Yinghuangia seranimata]MDI2125994.1 nucleoside phosphorylase [Yinghuangia seranimata]
MTVDATDSPAVLPITRIPASGLPGYAVVVGDPARAGLVAKLLDDATQIGANREYVTYAGTWRGVPLVVSSHGVGGPGAVCLFAELAEAGVHTIIRLGTAGSIARGIGDGDLIVADAAVRDDGVTQQLVPAEFPAFSTPEVVLALAAEARAHNAPHHRGTVWTRAAFLPGVLELPMKPYQQAGVLAIEMELSALLVFAALNGLRAGGALVIDGIAADDLVDEDGKSGYDPHRQVVADGVERAALVTLDAVARLAAADTADA